MASGMKRFDVGGAIVPLLHLQGGLRELLMPAPDRCAPFGQQVSPQQAKTGLPSPAEAV